jgi:hypothetical protein
MHSIPMTCYFRYLDPIFKKAGLQIDVDNRKRVDLIIHDMVGVRYKDCTKTLKAVQIMLEDEDTFVQLLRDACQARNIYLEY